MWDRPTLQRSTTEQSAPSRSTSNSNSNSNLDSVRSWSDPTDQPASNFRTHDRGRGEGDGARPPSAPPERISNQSSSRYTSDGSLESKALTPPIPPDSRPVDLNVAAPLESKRSDLVAPSGSRTTSRPKERKRPRHLTNVDRSVIIHRLKKGEKQATLAREFGISRAAVCHINKHREDVLTPFDLFANTPQGRALIENYKRPSTELERVLEVQSEATAVLLTRLGNPATTTPVFRSAATRLIRILLEEALVSFGTATLRAGSPHNQSIELSTTGQGAYAVALGGDGRVMLDVFVNMEPMSSTGWIQTTPPFTTEATSSWRATCLDLPSDVAQANVLLLTTLCTPVSSVCAALQELRGRQVSDGSICIVCISCTQQIVDQVRAHFPGVHFLTGAVATERNPVLSDQSVDGFLARYNAHN